MCSTEINYFTKNCSFFINSDFTAHLDFTGESQNQNNAILKFVFWNTVTYCVVSLYVFQDSRNPQIKVTEKKNIFS